LSIGAQVAVFDQPGAKFRFRPGIPEGVGGREVVVLDHLLHLFALDLGLGLDDIVFDEPVMKVAITPRRPDVVLRVPISTLLY
jgi:hypothetical protein